MNNKIYQDDDYDYGTEFNPLIEKLGGEPIVSIVKSDAPWFKENLNEYPNDANSVEHNLHMPISKADEVLTQLDIETSNMYKTEYLIIGMIEGETINLYSDTYDIGAEHCTLLGQIQRRMETQIDSGRDITYCNAILSEVVPYLHKHLDVSAKELRDTSSEAMEIYKKMRAEINNMPADQIKGFILTDNTEHDKIFRISEMVDAIYDMEKNSNTPYEERLTHWFGDYNMSAPKLGVTYDQIEKRYAELESQVKPKLKGLSENEYSEPKEEKKETKVMAELTSSKINIVENENSSLRALATIELNGYMTIKNVRIMEGKNGTFVSYPSYKTADGYKDYFHFADQETKKDMDVQILRAYIEEKNIKYFDQQDIKVSCTPINDGSTKGLATVTIDQGLVIQNVRIIDGKNGLFVSYPQQQTTEGKYAEVITPAKHIRSKIDEKVLAEYQKKLLEPEKANESKQPQIKQEKEPKKKALTM